MRTKAEARIRRIDGVATDFESIYRRHNRQVFLWCARIVRNTADAEDLTQEAFIHLLRKIDTYRGEAAFSTWLYRLTTNVVLMWLRKKVLPQTSLDEILDANLAVTKPNESLRTFDRTLGAAIARVDLERALAQVPAGPKSAFLLHDNENYLHREVAELLGWSAGTSKSHLHRARRQLRQLLKDAPDQAREEASGQPARTAEPGRSGRAIAQGGTIQTREAS